MITFTFTEGIKLPDYKTIQGLKDGDSYKYLGILEADRIKHEGDERNSNQRI